MPVQQVPLRDGERPREQHAERSGDDDVRVHDGVGGRPGVLGEQDALADAAAAADQLGDDVHDQRHGDRHPQPGRDERPRARHDHQGELPGAAKAQHRRGVPHHRVQRPDAVADLDHQRPEHRERDQRELHRQRRAPQHQGDRQDRDDRDRLEELDHADHAAVGEAARADQRPEGERRGGADHQPDRPPFEGLADSRPQRGR
jgi:hypothetical protein